jgi:tetraacyldisaccharide-1-P 4'-kinase
VASHQKLDIILENKGFQKSKLSKNVNIKKFNTEKKFFNENIQIFFDVEN